MAEHAVRRQWSRRWLLLGGVLLAVGLLAALLLALVPPGAEGGAAPTLRGAGIRAASAADFEDRFGIRIVLIGVTAGGGMIDLRYQVRDAAKAALLLDAETRPLLIAEDGGVVLRQHVRPEARHLEAGRSYSLLYSNVQNALRPGSLVSVVLGDLLLEHLVVR